MTVYAQTQGEPIHTQISTAVLDSLRWPKQAHNLANITKTAADQNPSRCRWESDARVSKVAAHSCIYSTAHCPRNYLSANVYLSKAFQSTFLLFTYMQN